MIVRGGKTPYSLFSGEVAPLPKEGMLPEERVAGGGTTDSRFMPSGQRKKTTQKAEKP